MQNIKASDLQEIFDKQKNNRWNIANTCPQERIIKLKKLRKAIVERKNEFYKAIWIDFRKNEFESFICEVFPAIEEIDFAIKNLKKWMKDKKAKRTYFLPTTHSYLHYEPLGQVLILSPWNYPLLLFISPIISAIAAGNVIIAKPSHKTPNVSRFLKSLIQDLFNENEIAVIEGDGSIIGEELIKLPFDKVFFTGSSKIGAHIAEKIAKHHSSITLELGGKSPTIILPNKLTSNNINDYANKIIWGKMLNAGQTCIAPDYVLCPKNIVNEFVKNSIEIIQNMYGKTKQERFHSKDFVHIIDTKTVERHKSLIIDAKEKGAKIVFGGECNIKELYTPPTIITNVTNEMELMKTEIFGPILPIVSYESLSEIICILNKQPKPLALYIFGNNKKDIQKILSNTTSGSTCINNCIIQIENLSVPFGGVGKSGTGNYHGFYGFKAFSHERNIMKQHSLNVIKIFYAPYAKSKLQNFLKKMLSFIKSA